MIKEFTEFLKENDALEKYQTSVMAYQKDPVKWLDSVQPWQYIDAAFPWRKDPDVRGYWGTLHRKWYLQVIGASRKGVEVS